VVRVAPDGRCRGYGLAKAAASRKTVCTARAARSGRGGWSPVGDEKEPEMLLTTLGPAVSPEVQRIAAEILPLVYEELKRAARHSRSRLGGGVTMQTTALVHEAFLRLGPQRSFADQTHFLRASALAMRHALINHSQARLADKRGGGALHVTLSHAQEFSVATDEGLVALNDALQRLAVESSRLARVVECRFFGGLTEEETARALDLSLRTVQRDWLKARAWLFRELSTSGQSGPSA
jgi:RNA polymerase sigma factor (TIGR02999 family)